MGRQFWCQTKPSIYWYKNCCALFFQTQDSLRHQRLLSPYSAIEALAPRALTRVKVCTASGDLPNQYCKILSETWFAAGKSPIKIISFHRPVTIDNATGRFCSMQAKIHIKRCMNFGALVWYAYYVTLACRHACQLRCHQAAIMRSKRMPIIHKLHRR